jgi:cytochrome c553
MRNRLAFAVLFLLSACSEDPAEPQPVGPAIQFERASAGLVRHGERLAAVLGCTGCHGGDLTGEDWSEPGFGRLWTANLTRALPDYSDRQLAEVITSGRRPDRELWEMPSHLFTQLTADDMTALIAFLRSKRPAGEIRPAPAFEDGARREIAAGTFVSSPERVRKEGSAWPPDAGQGHALGRYIVRATCAECHGMDLRGGRPNPAAVPRPDLRIAAAYDAKQFEHLMRTGLAAGNREVSLMSEVARGRYTHLTDAEIAAIHGYLKRVAEVAP